MQVNMSDAQCLSGSDFVSVMTSCGATGVNTRETHSTDRGVKVKA